MFIAKKVQKLVEFPNDSKNSSVKTVQKFPREEHNRVNAR